MKYILLLNKYYSDRFTSPLNPLSKKERGLLALPFGEGWVGFNRQFNIYLTLFFLFPLYVFSQSKKDIRKNDVKGMTEIITDFDGAKPVTRNDVSLKFDKNGEVILEINYDKTGALKEKIATKYNKDGDKLEEVFFDASGKQSSRITYRYDGFGQKSEEIQYDAKNALLTKSVYTSNSRGLKTERKTYDSKGKLIQVKKYVYEF